MIKNKLTYAFKWIAFFAFLMNLSLFIFAKQSTFKIDYSTKTSNLIFKNLEKNKTDLNEVELEEELEEEVEEDVEDLHSEVFNNPIFILKNINHFCIEKGIKIAFSSLQIKSRKIFIVIRNLRI